MWGHYAANLMIIFRGRRCARAQIARLEKRKNEQLFFTRFELYDLHFFFCFFSQSDRKVGFLWQVQYFVTFRLFSRGRATTSES